MSITTEEELRALRAAGEAYDGIVGQVVVARRPPTT